MASLATCEQAGGECAGQTYMRCFACGTPRCRNCTVMLPHYFHYGRRRICLTCIEDRPELLVRNRDQWAEMWEKGVSFEQTALAFDPVTAAVTDYRHRFEPEAAEDLMKLRALIGQHWNPGRMTTTSLAAHLLPHIILREDDT